MECDRCGDEIDRIWHSVFMAGDVAICPKCYLVEIGAIIVAEPAPAGLEWIDDLERGET